ncbi:MAG: hypothetical protein KGD64_13385 [Candidatus Heimdallarchaeota archaeon]|nr:hypothetical protein [Candidatus Heimdallarchaeota archaeon]
MVHNPFDDANSSDDPRKAKLRDQAQQQFIVQLQQRIANQSAKIEELENHILTINTTISNKDSELENYSKRLEEQRYYHEEDKKSRKDREHDLTKELQQKEIEIKKLIESPAPQMENTYPPEEATAVGNKVNEIVEKLMAFYKRPTNDVFVHSIKDLVKYCGSQGTIEQQILGLLINSEMPMTEENLVQQLNTDVPTITRSLFRLLQKENIKKVGQGYVIISSDFAEMTDISKNWGSLAPEQIYENLLSVVYVGDNREELTDAFTKARDALMEMGALSTLVTHEMSQQVDRIKKHPIETQELVDLIQKWKSTIKE